MPLEGLAKIPTNKFSIFMGDNLFKCLFCKQRID